MMELLAPAGSPEALRAAVQNGANAVYLGYGDFNARRGAKNFSSEEFSGAVAACHLYGVKVYLTLNTLLSDRELLPVAEVAREASALGVDAVLVQDLGVLSLLREIVPDLPLHASTQMTLLTSGGAAEAAALGLSRVVLARELSKGEIAAICRAGAAEVEVFVHGALCMCYSGQCAMSALLGGRSGNRGTCAQPCRLPYAVRPASAAAPRENPSDYPLSLKDSSLAAHLGELAELGVASLKIEGRMKRPEYVAVVTAIYARLLREKRPPTAEEERSLAAAFSRDGFTEGYYTGSLGRAMLGTRGDGAQEPKELFASAKRGYEKGDLRTIAVTFSCHIAAGKPAALTVRDEDGNEATVEGAVPEAARSRALTDEELAARLQKTGGTAFRCAEISVALDPALSLSAAAVNDLRRSALDALTAQRTAVPARRNLPAAPLREIPNDPRPPRLCCSICAPDQLSPALGAAARIEIPLELVADCDLAPFLGRTELCAVLPRIWRDGDESALREMVGAAKQAGVTALLLQNLGQFPLARESGLTLLGDLGLNVFNSRALALLQTLGLSGATLSFELRNEQIRDLQKCIPTEAVVYGRLPLQITENCAVKNSVGCRCRETPFVLVDRTGARFPLLRSFGCRTEIENSKVLFLADKDDYKALGLAFARLRFTTESRADCAAVFAAYSGGDTTPPEDFTRGLFYRGVQ